MNNAAKRARAKHESQDYRHAHLLKFFHGLSPEK
jgi:hypothetical protein